MLVIQKMLRTLAAITIALLVAFVLVIAVEFFSAVVYPLPHDFGGTTEEMCRHVEDYPAWILAVVIPAWAFTAFAGAWIARRIGNRCSAAVVGLLLLTALACNISMLPYPIWFKALNLLAMPIALLGGDRLAGRRKTAVAAVASQNRNG